MHDSYCSCIFCSIRVAIIFCCCRKNFLNKKFRVNSTKLESKPTRVFDITPSSDDFSSENDFLDRPRATFFRVTDCLGVEWREQMRPDANRGLISPTPSEPPPESAYPWPPIAARGVGHHSPPRFYMRKFACVEDRSHSFPSIPSIPWITILSRNCQQVSSFRVD